MKPPRYTILLLNSAGELDRRTARNEESCKTKLIQMIESLGYLAGGDTIKIIDNDE